LMRMITTTVVATDVEPTRTEGPRVVASEKN
jgi:hypothetical protein